MTARDDIFNRLKTTLDRVYAPSVRSAQADQRIQGAAPVLIPERGRAEGPAKVTLFISEAQAAAAEVRQLAGFGDVPGAVRDMAKEAGCTKLKIAPHGTLQAMDWSDMDISYGCGAGDDHVGVSMADAGVSETGTLVMMSGPQTPTTLNFLPDVHIVVLRTEDIVANYEEVWAQLRQNAKSNAQPDTVVMPRTVNWITGPSRTADIEQTLLLGAHGPRKLIVLLIDAQVP